jgi:PAS domain S-box-containing protein
MAKPTGLQLVRDDDTYPVIQVLPGLPSHDVQFYDSDEYLCGAVAEFLGHGIRASQPLIVIATPGHCRAITAALQASGFDTLELVEHGECVMLDARQTLAAFMEGPQPNRELFMATVGNVFERAVKNRGYLVVRAYGEMVDLLWKEGNIEGALALEELWNELAVRYSFSLLCAYAMGNFFKEAHTQGFERICAHHGHALPTEDFLIASESDRLRQVAMLQQRARALEAEVRHRRELEAALRDVLAHRRRMDEALRRSERELRDFLENAVEPMHWVGPDGIILWANRAELQLLGYTREDFIGQHIATFHADQQVIADVLRRRALGEELREFEARLIAKDGSTKHVLINSNVYREDGVFVHTRCFMRDITHLQRGALNVLSLDAEPPATRLMS